MGNNLQAQEQKSSKTTGWFVGINPFSPSIELETKHSESYTNFTRITETVSGDIETRREVTVDSNITSTSAADLRVEYEIGTPSAWFSSVTITTQQKIDGIEAGRYACREDIDYLGNGSVMVIILILNSHLNIELQLKSLKVSLKFSKA